MQLDIIKDHNELLDKYKKILMENNHKVVLNLEPEDKSTILRVFYLEAENLYCVIYNNKYKSK